MKKTLILALLSLLVLSGCGEVKDGQYAQMAQCLTEKGVKLYGAYWCPHCNEQKEIFGDDARYLTYIECDQRGEDADTKACREAEITHYPTWVFPGQDNLVGKYEPEILAKKANCEAADLVDSETEEINDGTVEATIEVTGAEETEEAVGATTEVTTDEESEITGMDGTSAN